MKERSKESTNEGFTLTKFTAKEIEFMKVVLSYKRVTPTHGQLAMKLNKDQRSITGTFFRMRERHKVRSNEELVKLFKERYPSEPLNA